MRFCTYRGTLDLKWERVLEGGALAGLVGNLDTVSLVLAKRAIDSPGERLLLNIDS